MFKFDPTVHEMFESTAYVAGIKAQASRLHLPTNIVVVYNFETQHWALALKQQEGSNIFLDVFRRLPCQPDHAIFNGQFPLLPPVWRVLLDLQPQEKHIQTAIRRLRDHKTEQRLIREERIAVQYEQAAKHARRLGTAKDPFVLAMKAGAIPVSTRRENPEAYDLTRNTFRELARASNRIIST